MSQIKVGINNHVVLKNAVITDKKWLQLTFKSLENAKPYSPFAALADDDVIVQENDLDINIFPPKVPTKTDLTEEKKVDYVVRDINRTKAVLLHIARVFLTKDIAKFGGNIYAGTGIEGDGSNFNQVILNNSVLETIHLNMCNMFIGWMKDNDLLGEDPKNAVRLKLVRQSKDKHFATLPSAYLDENPFMEPMDISEAASKVKFTAYEIKEGLDDGTPAAKETADKAPAGDTAPPTTESVFG